MLKPQGYGAWTDRESGKIMRERDTVTCAHCNSVNHVEPFCDPADLGGFCTLCAAIICKNCAIAMSKGEPCLPFMERLERLDTRIERGYGYIDPMRIK